MGVGNAIPRPGAIPGRPGAIPARTSPGGIPPRPGSGSTPATTALPSALAASSALHANQTSALTQARPAASGPARCGAGIRHAVQEAAAALSWCSRSTRSCWSAATKARSRSGSRSWSTSASPRTRCRSAASSRQAARRHHRRDGRLRPARAAAQGRHHHRDHGERPPDHLHRAEGPAESLTDQVSRRGKLPPRHRQDSLAARPPRG